MRIVVALGGNAPHGLALSPVKVFAKILGVPSLVLGLADIELEIHEFSAEAFDLFAAIGSHVPGMDNGT